MDIFPLYFTRLMIPLKFQRKLILMNKKMGEMLYSTKTLTDHQKMMMSKNLPKRKVLPEIEHIILIASGKGGVGKSTTSVNLALALSSNDKNGSIGLLDLDVFGPSIPKMLNLSGMPHIDKDDKMIPLINYNLKSMSMGYLVPESAAMVWRGPMVMSAVQRLIFKTQWGKLKYLIVDMPPGTGDTQLSVSQLLKLDGVVIVSTPQDIALQDAGRGVEMFRKVEIPVLGMVQNMSVYQCPNCGHREHIFGHEGVKDMAKNLDVPLLGDVPLDIKIRSGSDDGCPVVIADPNGVQAQSYLKIADRLIQEVEASKQR